MSVGLGMLAQAGSSFLNSMASQHGNTLASRLARPYQDFETPWGKGPYWTGQTQAEAQTWKYDALMASAKKHGIHKLYAMGTGPSISGGPVRAGTAGPQASGGGGYQARSLTEAQKLESAARVRNLNAQADMYAAQAAKFRQAPGGDPAAGFGGPPDVPAPAVSRSRKLIRGPQGGVYHVPKSVSPQSEWEDVIGEAADWTVGPALAVRMYRDAQRRRRQAATLVKKALQQKYQYEGFRKRRKSRFDRWLGR